MGGAGISPSARNSAATVRMTSGMISRISRAASRVLERLMKRGPLGSLMVMTAKLTLRFLDPILAVFVALPERTTAADAGRAVGPSAVTS